MAPEAESALRVLSSACAPVESATRISIQRKFWQERLNAQTVPRAVPQKGRSRHHVHSSPGRKPFWQIRFRQPGADPGKYWRFHLPNNADAVYVHGLRHGER